MLCGCGGSSRSPGGSVWTLNPRTAAVEGQTRVPGHPCALIAGPDGIWTTDLDPGALYRIDPQVRLVVKLHGERPCGVAVGRAIWVGTGRGILIRVLPPRRIDTGVRAGLGNVILYGGAVWAADLAGGVVRAGANVTRVTGIGETEQLAALDGAVWAIAAGRGELVRIDARTLAVRRFPIGPSPKALAAGDGAIWVALTDRRLLRFDPRRKRTTLVARLPDAPILLAPGGGTVWSLAANGRLARVDEHSARASIARSFGRGPFGLALGAGALWVGIQGR